MVSLLTVLPSNSKSFPNLPKQLPLLSTLPPLIRTFSRTSSLKPKTLTSGTTSARQPPSCSVLLLKPIKIFNWHATWVSSKNSSRPKAFLLLWTRSSKITLLTLMLLTTQWPAKCSSTNFKSLILLTWVLKKTPRIKFHSTYSALTRALLLTKSSFVKPSPSKKHPWKKFRSRKKLRHKWKPLTPPTWVKNSSLKRLSKPLENLRKQRRKLLPKRASSRCSDTLAISLKWRERNWRLKLRIKDANTSEKTMRNTSRLWRITSRTKRRHMKPHLKCSSISSTFLPIALNKVNKSWWSILTCRWKYLTSEYLWNNLALPPLKLWLTSELLSL